MRAKNTHRDGGSGRQQQEPLPEVRAGLVLVRSKDAGRTRRARRTWVLPILRVLVLAASMLCLTPTGGMITGMSRMDAWSGVSESEYQQQQQQQQHEDRSRGAQRQEYVVFVGVPEESAVLPLKALAQEMLARGYRASLALPHGFHAWVEDIPGLSFLSLKPDPTTATSTSTCNVTTHPDEPPTTPPSVSSPAGYPCPARLAGRGGKTAAACSGKGLGDAWGGGVGGGWGAGLSIWRGLKGSLVGAREFLGHLTAYLGFYRREEAVMYAPLVEALRQDPPALVIADRRASAAFRACSKLALRCVVNSAGLLGDLDRPPNSVPAPYTGFPMEGQTIGQRVHSILFRLVLALSRVQAARNASNDHLSMWTEEHSPPFVSGEDGQAPDDDDEDEVQHHEHHHHHQEQDYRSSTVMALGNSCFGSLEYPRELPARVHMVGPLWMSDYQDGSPNAMVGSNSHSRGGQRGWNLNLPAAPQSPSLSSSSSAVGDRETGAGASPSTSSKRKDKGKRNVADADADVDADADADAAARAAEGRWQAGDKVLRDVWSWLEPESVEEGEEAAPVVVVQLGYGGGWAWGVSPEAGVGVRGGRIGDNEDGSARLSWKAFREETVSQLSAVGCRTLWLDHGPHPDHQHQGDLMEGQHEHKPIRLDLLDRLDRSEDWHAEASRGTPARPRTTGGDGDGDGDGDVDRGARTLTGEGGSGEDVKVDVLNGRSSLMFLDVKEEIGAAGMVGSSEWLLRVMSHRLVTILVTDGDVRSLQTALWHGKPSVVVPTSPDQREAAARLVHSGAGVTCLPPCNAITLTAAVVDAHGTERRRGALRSSAALREMGGVGRAGDLLENELRTHLAAGEQRLGCPHGDTSLWEGHHVPAWCWSQERRDERFSVESERFFMSEASFSAGLSWFPDDPEWVWEEMSWLQRHLVDVYAVYGALVMGVGLLMKLTWNLVWSLCDITTAPPRGDLGSADNPNPRSPSPSPGKDPCAGTSGSGGGGGGKLARAGSGKWGSGGGGAGGKHGKGGGKHHGNISGAAVVHGDSTPPVSGGTYSKRMALTNGHS